MKAKGWREAVDSGQNKYFTGKPCKRGHVADRTTKGRSCVECIRMLNAAYVSANPDKFTNYKRKHYQQNPEKHKGYREKYKAKRNAHSKKWRANNPEKANIYKAKRLSLRKAAIPEVPEHLNMVFQSEIEAVYKEAKFMTDSTGIMRDVDHIFPLSKGGVHAPWNLRVMLASENRSKYNKVPKNEPVHVLWHGLVVSRLR